MVYIYGITFDHTTNYGSCLQAYALQEAVERITVFNERCSYKLIPLHTLLEIPPANLTGKIKRYFFTKIFNFITNFIFIIFPYFNMSIYRRIYANL